MKIDYTNSPILFRDPVPPNGWLSTFSDHEITMDGEKWPTVEHFFQAQKFSSKVFREQIRMSKSPAEAKRLGKQWKTRRRQDWFSVKESIMLKALRAKFTQHGDLQSKLLETGDRHLIEDSKEDLYWGIGFKGQGKNRLGNLIMKLRDEFRKEAEKDEL